LFDCSEVGQLVMSKKLRDKVARLCCMSDTGLTVFCHGCCSIFKTSIMWHSVREDLTPYKCQVTMRRLQCKAPASMTTHWLFCGRSQQRYMSSAECLEPSVLDFLLTKLAGKYS